MAENILAEGLRFFEKNANAPDFVMGTIVITIDEFKNFINNNQEHLTDYNGKKQLKLQQLKSKQGKVYFNVDNYKPSTAPTAGPHSAPATVPQLDSSLPF
jgi:hypothetical protein